MIYWVNCTCQLSSWPHGKFCPLEVENEASAPPLISSQEMSLDGADMQQEVM